MGAQQTAELSKEVEFFSADPPDRPKVDTSGRWQRCLDSRPPEGELRDAVRNPALAHFGGGASEASFLKPRMPGQRLHVAREASRCSASAPQMDLSDAQTCCSAVG